MMNPSSRKSSRYGYKQLLSEKLFLKVRARAAVLHVNVKSILVDKDLMVWETPSAHYGEVMKDGSRNTTIYIQRVDFSGFNEKFDISKRRYKDLTTAIIEAGLKVHCTCPAWLYWGYKYMAYKRGYGLEKEERYPRIRNPHLQGYLCKHLYAVMTTYPFWANTIAKRYKQTRELEKRWGGDTDFDKQ